MKAPGRRAGAALLPALAVIFAVAAAGCGGGGGGEAASTTATTSGGGLQAGTITVGYGNNLTGFLAVHDHIISDGAKAEVQELNNNGGIGGKVKIDLMLEDTKTDPAVSVQVARDLTQKGVDFLVLPCNTDFQVAMAAVAQRANTITLSPCNADPTLGEKYSVYWPVGMGGNAQMAQLATYAQNQGYKSAWVLDDPGFLYVHLMAMYFKEAAADRGMSIAGTDTIKVGDTNFSSQVTKIKNASPQPDVIMTGLFTPYVDALIKQLRGAGVQTPVIGSDGMDTHLNLTAGGKAVNGTTFTAFGFDTPGSPLDDFYGKMEQLTGDRPDGSYAALGAATIQVLAGAIESAGSTDPQAVADVLSNGATFSTSLNDIVYQGGGDHNPTTDVAVVTIANGKFKLVTIGVPENVPAP
jgi:branched-chain amino acid transport system substrate-binding protein